MGAALRFSFLTYNPPSLNWDEVSHGYNAYSILKTGMDQWGQKFPIFNFRAYGDYPTTLNLYLTIPFIAIFGLSDFAIRFPHALLGVLTIISAFYLAFGLTKNKNVSLLSAFLVAAGPWYLFTSRFVLQSNLSVFLLTTSGALFFNRDKSKHFISLSLFALFLTLFSYHTTRIVSPILLLATLVTFGKEYLEYFRIHKVHSGILAVLIFSFFVISGYILQNPDARARGGVLFLVDQGAVNRIIEQRNTSKLPPLLNKLIHNRPVYFAEHFLTNYVGYFSPGFLFFNGGTQYQFSLPGKGLIYPVGLPFFYIGLALLLLKSLKDKNYRLLLFWILIAPIPASITDETFTVLRATTILPIPEILMSLGFFWILEKVEIKYRSALIWVCALILYVYAESYMVAYFTTYRTQYSWSWQYGYKEAVLYSEQNYSKYDKIVVTKKYGEPHEYFLFFLKWSPDKYQNDSSAVRFMQSGWYWVDRFDKFYFVNDWQIEDKSLGNKMFIQESKNIIDCSFSKCLLITSPGNAPVGWKKLQSINFLDGSRAFEIYDNSTWQK